MKKLKLMMNRWWYHNVILRFMKKYQHECIQALRDPIVSQMWQGEVSIKHINRWLHIMGSKTIRGYVLTGDGTPIFFYSMPIGDRRAEVEKKYGHIKLVY